ncbi:MAG TPA: hypothetical protein VLT87_11890 [Thermoanaerobaculia bacterium]|nr:hypothetical protein [Thermoanaerobaculia bacterium]
MIAAVAAETDSRLLLSNSIEVSVTWKEDDQNPQNINGLWTVEPQEVTVKSTVALLKYTLSRDSTPGVQFTTGQGKEAPPVLWIFPSSPKNFDVTVVEKDGKPAQQLIIADANLTSAGEEPFHFRLVAVYNNVVRISPDPTIINVDPTQQVSRAAS